MSTFLRQAANASRNASHLRGFSSTPTTRKDIVQDLYLRRLKGYKPVSVAKDAHVGVVKSFSLPPKPQTPLLPTDLASDLAAYDAAEPTLAHTDASVSEAGEEAGSGADAFLELLERDLPKPEAHH